MTQRDIVQTIREMVSRHLGLPASQVSEESSLTKDLGADSLDAVELVMALEAKFKIDLPDQAAKQFRTIGDVARIVSMELLHDQAA